MYQHLPKGYKGYSRWYLLIKIGRNMSKIWDEEIRFYSKDHQTKKEFNRSKGPSSLHIGIHKWDLNLQGIYEMVFEGEVYPSLFNGWYVQQISIFKIQEWSNLSDFRMTIIYNTYYYENFLMKIHLLTNQTWIISTAISFLS